MSCWHQEEGICDEMGVMAGEAGSVQVATRASSLDALERFTSFCSSPSTLQRKNLDGMRA